MTERFRLRSNAVFAELGDGSGVILDLDSKAYYSLNATGVFVWKQLANCPSGAEEIAARLSTDFEVEHKRATVDVAELLRDLKEQRLIDAEATTP
jgi:hypothetical protein